MGERFVSTSWHGLWFEHSMDAAAWERGGYKDIEIHDNLRAQVAFATQYAAWQRWPRFALVVTSLIRPGDEGSPHGYGRAMDLAMIEDFDGKPRGRVGGLTLRQSQELSDVMDSIFFPYRGWSSRDRHSVVIVREHGTAPHVHMQCSAALGFMSSNYPLRRLEDGDLGPGGVGGND